MAQEGSKNRGGSIQVVTNISGGGGVRMGPVRRAEDMLNPIETFHMEGYYDASTETVLYNLVMNMYSI